jgi:hypothetical protein
MKSTDYLHETNAVEIDVRKSAGRSTRTTSLGIQRIGIRGSPKGSASGNGTQNRLNCSCEIGEICFIRNPCSTTVGTNDNAVENQDDEGDD